MKVWITRYALSKGVIEVDAERTTHCEGGIRYTENGVMRTQWGKNWHTSKAAATDRVRDMIRNKRKSLAKQVAKLDELAILNGLGP